MMARRVLILLGTFIPVVAALGCRSVGRITGETVPIDAPGSKEASAPRLSHVDRAALARTDPKTFLRLCRNDYIGRVHGYRCRLVRQERLSGELRPEQEFDVVFRESPHSVELRWVRGPLSTRHVVYVEKAGTHDAKKKARVELPGVPLHLHLDIHGSVMKGHARRPLDQFGFRRILEAIEAVCEACRNWPGYHLAFLGEETVSHRPCYRFERRLPVNQAGSSDLAALLRLWIDQEWLVPIRIEEFADSDGEILLGRYEFLEVVFEMNPTTVLE